MGNNTMNTRINNILDELHVHLKRLYGERLIDLILYGSHARGDMESGSDIDILVILHGDVLPMDEIKRTGGIVSRISLKYNEVISCLFMDEERYLHRNGPLLRNIRKEGIPL